MSELVSSFLDVQLGKQKYLFFLITWNDYVTTLSDELDKQWQAFGADLGPSGTVVRAYRQHAKKSFDEVMAKQWPEEIFKRFGLEQDPFMVVIDRDFQPSIRVSTHGPLFGFRIFSRNRVRFIACLVHSHGV